jgi:Ca-activated chloride channel family protein
MSSLPNYYEILGLSRNATNEQIHEAAKTLGERFPDEARDPTSNVAFRQLVQAHETLSDPVKRRRYDEQLREQTGELITVSVIGSRETVARREEEQLLYLLMTMHAPPAWTETSYPVNVCLVIDRSTSMRGARLERVQAAARLAISRLAPGDVLSIVTFSDRADVIAPAETERERYRLLNAVNAIEPSGGTEIYQGLLAGVRELVKMPTARYTNHLVLLTDGHTYGDEAHCLRLAEEAVERGIAFSAFGIGTDWNDNFLDQLVAPSGGYSTYIENPAELSDYLQKQLQELATIYAKSVHLTLDLPPSVTCKDLFKLAPFAQPLTCQEQEVNLGAVESARPLAVLLELSINAATVGQTVRIPLRFRATIPAQQVRNRRIERVYTLRVAPGEVAFTPPSQVISAVQMLNLYRMSEKAWQEAQQGDANAATNRMERLGSRLIEAGHTRLGQEVIAETRRLAQVGTLSAETRKRLKYETRSLLTRTIFWDDDD